MTPPIEGEQRWPEEILMGRLDGSATLWQARPGAAAESGAGAEFQRYIPVDHPALLSREEARLASDGLKAAAAVCDDGARALADRLAAFAEQDDHDKGEGRDG